jgi:hypothetical protein
MWQACPNAVDNISSSTPASAVCDGKDKPQMVRVTPSAAVKIGYALSSNAR